jgi:hypothetical protein
MEQWQKSLEARVADIEETLRHVTVRLVALEETVAGRTQTVVEELDELRSDVERIKEGEGG